MWTLKLLNRRMRAVLIKTILALGLSACLSTNNDEVPIVQGGGSDSETLTGMVFTAEGKPSPRTLVKLVPTDYDPSQQNVNTIRFSTTNDSGQFKFEKVDSLKPYNIIAGKSIDKKWALFKDATVKKGIATKGLKITLADAKVFLFSLHTPIYETKDSGIAYFPGTDILANCDGINPSTVDSVPMGAMRFVVQSRSGWKHDTTLVTTRDTVSIIGEATGITVLP